VRAHPNPALFELVVEFAEATLEPRAFDGHFEVPEAQLEQLLVGQRGPSEPTGHGDRNRRGRSFCAMVSCCSKPNKGAKRGRGHPGAGPILSLVRWQ
jgi:hypothetical protein